MTTKLSLLLAVALAVVGAFFVPVASAQGEPTCVRTRVEMPTPEPTTVPNDGPTDDVVVNANATAHLHALTPRRIPVRSPPSQPPRRARTPPQAAWLRAHQQMLRLNRQLPGWPTAAAKCSFLPISVRGSLHSVQSHWVHVEAHALAS